MSKKVVLFLSPPKDNGEETAYRCPDGSVVTGTQTNEAPLKYLLQTNRDVSEVVCIVTKDVKERAWDSFVKMVEAAAPAVNCTLLQFTEAAAFQEEVLPRVLSTTSEGDEILLETTGGFRHTIMHLLLISRALSYAGVRTVGAVYSNYVKREIEDLSGLISLFDLIGGMQELTSFGNVQKLKAYYRTHLHDPAIDRLLEAVTALWESITLCRAKQISSRMEQFNEAKEQASACADPLMRALLPAFNKKYGARLTTPGLIKWCLESDMLQQALTLYKELIPVYLLKERKDLLRVREWAPEPNMGEDPMRKYESEEEARFYEQLLKMGHMLNNQRFDPDDPNDFTVVTLEHLEELLPGSYFAVKCSAGKLRTILMDYLYIRALRNMTNHAADQALGNQQLLLTYLNHESQYYKPVKSIRADDVRSTLKRALENLRQETRKEKKQ